MTSPDVVFHTLVPIVEALEHLRVPYHISGSVASSKHGFGRSTVDVDIVADIRDEHVLPLVKLLDPNHYVDAAMIRNAILRRSSFNVVNLSTMLKVDVFIPKEGQFDRLGFTRAQLGIMPNTSSDRLFSYASPEDTILRKLEWFRMGGGVSERQWMDAIGVLKVQAKQLDYKYLWHWAHELSLEDLLQQALVDAGIEE